MPAHACICICIYGREREDGKNRENRDYPSFPSLLSSQSRAFFDFVLDGTRRLVRRPYLANMDAPSHADGRLLAGAGLAVARVPERQGGHGAIAPWRRGTCDIDEKK